MSNLGYTINAADLPAETPNDPIPEGWYDGTITEADVKDTKAGTGRYIKLRFDIIGPTQQGRVVFTNINIQNPNPKAEEIGHQQLGQIMKAAGLQSLSDTDQLIGVSCGIKVAVRASEQYGDQNEVKAYRAIAGSPAPAPTASAAAPAAATPPWKR